MVCFCGHDASLVIFWKGQIIYIKKIIFVILASTRNVFDEDRYRDSNGALSFTVRGLELKKNPVENFDFIEFN